MAYLDKVPGWALIGGGLLLGALLLLATGNLIAALIPVIVGGVLSGMKASMQGPPSGS